MSVRYLGDPDRIAEARAVADAEHARAEAVTELVESAKVAVVRLRTLRTKADGWRSDRVLGAFVARDATITTANAVAELAAQRGALQQLIRATGDVLKLADDLAADVDAVIRLLGSQLPALADLLDPDA